ncbi:peptide chain release factor N(5)-glutamine methyltransferase [Georgenia sp. Z1491]|uniref:peptide chain release factor N(5)-glutamine methyltransferase n=1 Tax=Georgenia sp. Z1491 TaxID=3416707 RepID=UPI003CF45993
MNPAAPTWRAAVSGAARLLAEAGVPSPEVDARLLAEHVAGLSPLLMAPAPTPDQVGDYAHAVERRAAREPLQHITGRMHFRRLELHAGPGAFVVRPETELVAGAAVDAARAAARDGRRPVVVDLCTGSGAIALAVATEVATAEVHAVELSADALAIARRNVERHAPRVRLARGDARSALPELEGTCDVVVSNPPYVPDDAVPRDPEVRVHDPSRALYGGGSDGLDVPRAVLARARDLLAPGGVAIVEHSEEQGAALRDHARALGLAEARTHRDLTGRERFLTASAPGHPGAGVEHSAP